MKKQATLTQLEFARQGIVTDKMQQVATTERIDPEILRQHIADGTAVICHNNRHSNGIPLAVGKGLRTKVNANIGTSKDDTSIDKELEKARVAVAAGADAIMDLSTGGDIAAIRRTIVEHSPMPVGTVPLYEAVERVQDAAGMSWPGFLQNCNDNGCISRNWVY